MYGEIHGEKHMPKNLNNFISNIETQGVARQNKYRVEISGPASTRPIHGERDLDLRCESITFPGTNVRSVPDTLRYGPAREQGQGMTYGPFTATFICSPDLREKIYFEWWQQRIINHLTWEANYYDDYKGEVRIIQLDEQNLDTYDILVTEAYPKTISPQDVSWSSNDAYQTVAVEFTYRYWLPTPDWMKAIGQPGAGEANVDDFGAFSGGRGLRQYRAVDQFSGFSGGRGLTQYRSVDNMGAYSGGRGARETRAVDNHSGFSSQNGVYTPLGWS